MEDRAEQDAVSVMVDYGPIGRLRVLRRCLRVDGVFVDIGNVALPQHSHVEVTISVKRDNRLQVHTLSAIVMGRSRHGTNLTFQNCRRETYHLLRQLVGNTCSSPSNPVLATRPGSPGSSG